MTDKQTLFEYRLAQAKETLRDAENMLKNNLSPRSVINRAYYSMFYALLSLFIKDELNLKTSKHAGVIAIFDKEYVHTGKVDKKYSKLLHKMFEARQEGDYKELTVFSQEDARSYILDANEFWDWFKDYVGRNS